jgi:hypothetical protein
VSCEAGDRAERLRMRCRRQSQQHDSHDGQTERSLHGRALWRFHHLRGRKALQRALFACVVSINRTRMGAMPNRYDYSVLAAVSRTGKAISHPMTGSYDQLRPHFVRPPAESRCSPPWR